MNNGNLLDNVLDSCSSVKEFADAGIQLELESDFDVLQNKLVFLFFNCILVLNVLHLYMLRKQRHLSLSVCWQWLRKSIKWQLE